LVLYEALLDSRDGPPTRVGLPELPIQYADFAHWQRRWLQDEEFERQLGYWRQQLGGAPQLLALSTDRPRPAVPSYAGGKQARCLPDALCQALGTLCQRAGCTPFMTFVAAFDVLLWRYSGARDLLVGTPIANRNRVELEGLIGFFANTLVLRTRIARDASFRELLEQVRQVTLGAYEHQDLPFEKVVEALQPERALTHHPLVQVMFVLQNAPSPPLERSGLEMSIEPAESGPVIFDLVANLQETPAGLRFSLRYPRALFDDSTIARMANHFRGVLEALVADPDARLSQLELLTAAERQQQLVEWNDTAAVVAGRSLVAQFEEQAARAPEAVALVCGSQQLSYGELNRRANQLAHHLRRGGVGPEVPVAICTERSPEWIVGLFGILKAGGAFVPADPAYPSERLRFILEDTGAPVLLTQRRLRDVFAAYPGAMLCLDADWPRVAGESTADPPRRISGDRLAYVIYTSGSTGRPKGVAVARDPLPNLIAWHHRRYRPRPGDRASQMAGPAFDASVLEIWSNLTAGATLCIADQETRTSPAQLRSWLDGASIALCLLVSPMTELLLAEEWSPGSALRSVMTGGDWLYHRPPPGLGFELVNHYGPTETTVLTTCGRVAPTDQGTGVPDIGRPIPNVRVYLLDRHLRTVPRTVPGELCLGGDCLARGYLHLPAQTAERFVPDPFGGGAGGRLYRSGDLARYRSDGAIEFLGRIDDQVKIRGFRIELGEIEAVLGKHPAVREVAVVVHDAGEPDRPRQQRLVAYLVAEPPPDRDELRRLGAERLPEYMIPSALVMLESLPLLPTGKVDRAALSRRVPPALIAGPAGRSPRQPLEEVVAAIWCELLGVEQIGIGESFFDVGGHSLLATQVASRIRQALGVELALREFFEAPTIAALARRLAAALATDDDPAARLRPRPADRHDEPPLSFAQERLWFLDQLEPGMAAYNIPAVVRLSGRLDPEALAASLTEVLRRHESLRTRFVARRGEPVQRIGPPQEVAVPLVDLSRLADDRRRTEARRLSRAEARRPFDLARGPLLRGMVARADGASHLALLTIHHIVSDGWSMRVLVRELGHLYGARVRGLPPELPELAIQYADYALWQRERLRGERLERELAYWREHLGTSPEVLDLPTDRPVPKVVNPRGGTVRRLFPAALTKALRARSREAGATLFMMLLAGFQALLHRESGQREVSVGTPIAGRTHAELEDLIGFFVNTLVLRSTLAGDESFGAHLAAVRERCLGAYTHQEVPFERLVAELAPARSLTHTPLFQAMFLLDEGSPEKLEWPELRIEPAPELAGGGSAQLGRLTLTVVAGEEELSAHLAFQRELYDRTSMARLLAHLETLLAAAVAEPKRRVSELPLVAAAEQHQVRWEWNDTRTPFAWEGGVHRAFERRAAQCPDAVAIVRGGCGQPEGRWTYGELNRRANRVAYWLREGEVEPEQVVGLCVERSPAMVAALFGILKAGAAFLPLSPAAPRERLAYQLTDAGAVAVVATARSGAPLPAGAWKTLWLDPEHQLPPPAAAGNPGVPVAAENACYAIHTSGSTGQPKGVQVSHRSVANIVASFVTSYAISAADRVLQQTTITFDVAVNEIFPILTRGGALVLVPPAAELHFERLAALVAERGVTILGTAPSVLARWNEVSERGLGRLRLILSGGEALAWSDVDRLVAAATVINGYGPTEATVCALSYDLQRMASDPRSAIPLGRPLANYEVLICDRAGRVLGIGHPGELCLAGPGLARGYLGRPARTAASFVPHPRTPGERLYRTGDLGRWLADGNLAFLGRIDRQVKIRGLRIEPGEIEARLGEHPGVREAAVVVCDDDDAHGRAARLVAYYVPSTDAIPAAAELREHLREELPSYMVPAAYVRLAALPLTIGGKVDYRALPAPEAARQRPANVPPRDEVERRLARIWEELLEIEAVSARDDFFELGGHSLLLVRLMARIEDEFGRSWPLTLLFETPTLEQLAAVVRTEREASPSSPLVLIQPRGSRTPFFCVHGIEGTVVVFRDLARQLGPEQPFYGLRAPGLEEAAQRGPTIEAMAMRYLESVQHVQPEGPYLLGGWSFGCAVAFEMAQQLTRAGQRVALVALFDGVPPGEAGYEPPASDVELLAEYLGMEQGRSLEVACGGLGLSPEKRLRRMVERARASGRLPSELGLDRLKRLLAGYRARSAIYRAYRPELYSGRVSFFRARPPESEAATGRDRSDDEAARGWSRLARRPIRSHDIPGSHVVMFQEPAVREMAARLRLDIDTALDGESEWR